MAIEQELQEAAAGLVKRRETWLDMNRPEVADAGSTAYRMALEKKYTEGGVLLAAKGQLEEAVGEDCRRRDRDATLEGSAIDLDADLLAQRIASEVAAHEPLPSLATRYGVNTERGLTALMVDSLRERRDYDQRTD